MTRTLVTGEMGKISISQQKQLETSSQLLQSPPGFFLAILRFVQPATCWHFWFFTTCSQNENKKPPKFLTLLGCPNRKIGIGSKVIESVGDFTPRNSPCITRWHTPLIRTIDPSTSKRNPKQQGAQLNDPSSFSPDTKITWRQFGGDAATGLTLLERKSLEVRFSLFRSDFSRAAALGVLGFL